MRVSWVEAALASTIVCAACVADPVAPQADLRAADLGGADLRVDLSAGVDLSADVDLSAGVDLSADVDLEAADLTSVPDLVPVPPVFLSSQGLEGGQIQDVAAFDSQTAYALAAGFLWKSDFNLGWVRGRAFPQGARVAVSPGGKNLVAVGELDGAVWRTLDGVNWEALDELAEAPAKLEFVPNETGNDLWALSGSKVRWWKSAAPSAWEEVSTTSATIYDFAGTGNTGAGQVEALMAVYNTATGDGLVQFKDSVWSNATPAASSAARVAARFTDALRFDIIGKATGGTPSDTLSVATTGGAWTTCNPTGGAGAAKWLALFPTARLAATDVSIERRLLDCGSGSWTIPFGPETSGAKITNLKPASSTAASGVAVAASTFGVLRTTDSGATIAPKLTTMTAVQVRRIAIDPVSNQVLAATDSGVFFSDEGGSDFYLLGALQHLPATFVGRSANNVFAASPSTRFHTTSGSSYSSSVAGVGDRYAMTPAGIVLLCNGGLIQRSLNAGATFSTFTATGSPTPSCDHVAVATSNSELWIYGSSFQYSIDNGGEWLNTNQTALTAPLTQFEVSPNFDTTAYFVQAGALHRVTPTGGIVQFSTPEFSVRSFALVPGFPERIYATGPQGLFWTNDGGLSFRQLRSEPGELVYVDPGDHKHVLFATTSDGLFVAKF